jgi:HD-like signal output (HDOD) protein
MSGGQLLPSNLVRGIKQLEPMPVTAQRLVALMQGEDVSLAKIAELVEFDQAIAASVLRMARSWSHAGSRPPETVRDAVVRVGTVPLLNLVLGEYLTRLRTAAHCTTSAKTTCGRMPLPRNWPSVP